MTPLNTCSFWGFWKRPCASALALAGLLGIFSSCASTFPILQGPTDRSRTQFTVVLPKSRSVLYTVEWTEHSLPQVRSPSAQTRTTREFSTTAADHVTFEGLRPGILYQLKVKNTETGALLDSRTFRTLDLTARGGKVAVASCMDDSYTAVQGPMWQALLKQKPDLVFLIGDNVYVDQKDGHRIREVTPELFWTRYVDTFQTLEIYRAPHLVPVFSVWDDHDYGLDDSDRNFALKSESLAVAEAFFPQREWSPFFVRGPARASLVTAWGVRFYLLDDRSLRENSPAHETHFGAEQERWLETSLRSSTQPAVLLNGNQWFGGYQPRFENFQGRHPRSFARFVREIRNQKPVVLLVSGDRHLLELMRIPEAILGYETYELTTSGIHAILSGQIDANEWTRHPNPYRIEGSPSEFNFATIDVTAPRPLTLTLRGHGLEGRKIFEVPVVVERKPQPQRRK